MSRYVVRFLKNVVGGDHREVKGCLRWFEIEAEEEIDRRRDGEKEVAQETDHLSVWSLHADRIEVRRADSLVRHATAFHPSRLRRASGITIGALALGLSGTGMSGVEARGFVGALLAAPDYGYPPICQ